MFIIASADRNYGIGNRGGLLCRVSADMKNFRALTEGKTVILGSKTLATFPGGKPLKNRRNIIMSRRQEYTVEGAEVLFIRLRSFLRFPGYQTLRSSAAREYTACFCRTATGR